MPIHIFRAEKQQRHACRVLGLLASLLRSHPTYSLPPHRWCVCVLCSRARAFQFRRRLPPMQEPPYNMAEVQRADRELVGSVATRLEGRPAWLPHLAEMLLLCNEASKRYAGLE